MEKREFDKVTTVQRSIIKKYRKTIWNNFVGAVQEYDLIKETMKAQGEKKKDRVITTFVPNNLKKQIEDSKTKK